MNDEDQKRDHRIQRSISERRCAQCEADLNKTGIVGSGSFSDGLFCSLDCYAKFHSQSAGQSLASARHALHH